MYKRSKRKGEPEIRTFLAWENNARFSYGMRHVLPAGSWRVASASVTNTRTTEAVCIDLVAAL